MKILVIHDKLTNKEVSAVHIWRIIRPFRELQKHTDWQIDHQSHLIDTSKLNSKDELTEDELVRQADKLKDYDIIWTSYFTDVSMFALSQVLGKKYGTKFVIDDDDDIYNIADDNPFWLKMTKEDQWKMQRMVEEAPIIVTTNDRLAKHYAEKSYVNANIYVLPNFISKSEYHHPIFENSPEVVITFFGGYAHLTDLENTGVMEALQQIMNKYKNVRAHFVGCPPNTYLPKGRYTFEYGTIGFDWTKKIWPGINADISLGPLVDTQFNRMKSPIKWMESAMIPSAFIGSNVYPFKGFVKDGVNGLLVKNTTEDWYEGLEKLVTDRTLRKKLASQARKDVEEHYIENNWQKLKQIVEDITKLQVTYDW